MESSEYKLMSEVQDGHWWWLGRRKIIETMIERHIDCSQKLLIADVGCGFGANIPMLRQYGDVVGLELQEDALRAVKKKWGEENARVWKSPEKLMQQFDLILMADVLEHIPNDQEAVEWMFDHLKDGGHALLTVPAHQFFWSQMDEAVHHIRRYGHGQFLALFYGKWKIKKFSFYNFFLFPIKAAFVVVTRFLRVFSLNDKTRSYNDIPPSLINILFKYILWIESELIANLSLPFGVSMVILVQKPARSSL